MYIQDVSYYCTVFLRIMKRTISRYTPRCFFFFKFFFVKVIIIHVHATNVLCFFLTCLTFLDGMLNILLFHI